MKNSIVLLLTLCCLSCSSINVKRNSTLSFESLFKGEVIEKDQIILEANESKSGRILVGFLSAGPIGAIATANTESGFSEPKAFNYKLEKNDNERLEVVSYSSVEKGQCVEVVSPDGSNIDILIVVPVDECTTK